MLTKTSLAAGGLAALLLAASPALAQHAAKHDKESKAKEADLSAGQTAAVDPATGKLRPVTPEEARELIAGMAPWLDQSSDGLTVVYHPNGMATVDLEDRFQSVSVARLAGDGSVVARCVTSVKEAGQFLGAPAGATPPGKPAERAAKRAKAASQPTGTATSAALEEK